VAINGTAFRSSALAEADPSGLRYRGWIRVGRADRLEIDLRLVDREMVLVAANGVLGAWPIEEVEVERTEGDEFRLSLSGEQAVFMANDVLTFAYQGLPQLQRAADVDLATRLFRRWRRGHRRQSVAKSQPAKSIALPPARTPKQDRGRRLLAAGARAAVVGARWGKRAGAGLARGGAGAFLIGIKGARSLGQGSSALAETLWRSAKAWRQARHSVRAPAKPPTRTEVSTAPGTHSHRYVHQAVLGGIDRVICSDCGQMSVVSRPPDRSQLPQG